MRANLFVIGAMKAGSTTLHEYLNRHPDIAMTFEKEPGYFVPELWKDRPEEDYLRLLRHGEGKTYVGESSTHYSKIPTYKGVPERIHRYNPDARIIYIVRHPIKRLISHYHHAVRDIDFYGETRDVFKAVEKDPMYLGYSDYALQLEPYYRLFGHEQVYVITFEELVVAPQQELDKLLTWLGLSSTKAELDNIAANQAPKTFRRARGLGLLNRFRHSEVWEKVSRSVPQKIKDLGVRMAEETTSETLSEEDQQRLWQKLEPTFAAKQRSLETMTGRRFDIWGLKGEQ